MSLSSSPMFGHLRASLVHRSCAAHLQHLFPMMACSPFLQLAAVDPSPEPYVRKLETQMRALKEQM